MNEEKAKRLITRNNVLFVAIMTWIAVTTVDTLVSAGYEQIIVIGAVGIMLYWLADLVYGLVTKKPLGIIMQKPYTINIKSIIVLLSALAYFVISLSIQIPSPDPVNVFTIGGCVFVVIILCMQVRQAHSIRTETP